MSKQVKIWLLIAGALVLSGAVLFVSIMADMKWSFANLQRNGFVTNEHEIAESFSGLSIAVDTADVSLAVAKDNVCRVVCHEREKVTHAVTVKDGALSIEVEDTRRWYEKMFGFGTPHVTVYLPAGQYAELVFKGSTGDLEIPADFSFSSMDVEVSTGDVHSKASVAGEVKIQTSTGNIRVEGITADSLWLKASTGSVRVEGLSCAGDAALEVTTGKVHFTDASLAGDVTLTVSTGNAVLERVGCRNLASSGDTGNLTLKSVLAAERFTLERSTGDIRFESCDAAELFVTTETGDVTGTLRSEKVFIPRTDTGDVDVPKTTSGGRCEITTDTGDIEIAIG